MKMPPREVEIECTASCSCGYCCNWEWGVKLPGSYNLGLSPSWMPLRLVRTRNSGSVDIDKQLPVVARYWTREVDWVPLLWTHINGRVPAQARPPVLSRLSLSQISKLPSRLLFF